MMLTLLIAHVLNIQQFRSMLDHAQRLEIVCVRSDWMVRSTMTCDSILVESLTTGEWYFWDGVSCTVASSTGQLLPEDDCAGPADVASLIHMDGCDHAAVTQSWLVPGLITTDSLTGRRRIPGQSITVEVNSHEFRVIWTSAQPIFIEGVWSEE